MFHRRIAWLHLSDFHFLTRKPDSSDQQDVLTSLIDEDLPEQLEAHNIKLDFVFATGDIGFSGKAEEYALAASFFDKLLAQTSIQKERLFVIPGNHDVDRAKIRRAASLLAKDLVDPKKEEDEFRTLSYDTLFDPENHALISKRLEGYSKFTEEYFGERRSSEILSCTASVVPVNGLQVGILPLNSAWMCADDKDQNQLVVGLDYVTTGLKDLESAHVRISLIHHPFDWLYNYEKNLIKSLLEDKSDFILSGHVHNMSLEFHSNPDYATTLVVSGSAFETKARGRRNAYNLVVLDFDGTPSGKILFRDYRIDGGSKWSADTHIYKKAKNGEYSWKLSEHLRTVVGRVPTDITTTVDRQIPLAINVEARSLLLERIDSLEEHLRSILDALGKQTGALPNRLELVANDLLENNLSRLRNVVVEGAYPHDKCWTLLISIHRHITQLDEELRDLLYGTRDELCSWSNALLAEIGHITGEPWDGDSILSSTRTPGLISHLIRISTPHFGLWSLPLCVHSYASLLKVTSNAALLIGISDPDDYRIIPRLVTDMLATFLMGPSYGWSVVKLSYEFQNGMSPNSKLRLEYIKNVLQKLGDTYVAERHWLDQLWEQENEGRDVTALYFDDPHTERYLKLFDKLYAKVFLTDDAPKLDHAEGKAVVNEIRVKQTEGTMPKLDHIQLSHIVIAAWYSRLLDYPQVTTLEQTRAYYEKLYRAKLAQSVG